MNAFPELLCSLSLQVTLLLLVTRWLAGRQSDCRGSERLWVGCHRAILTLSAGGCLLPHLRLLPAPIWPALTGAGSEAARLDGFAAVLFVVWAAGAAVPAASLVAAFLNTLRRLRAAEPLSDLSPGLVARIQGRAVRVLVTPQATSPYCWQLHRPVVVLPQFLLDFPESERNAIFRHELAHLVECHPLHLFEQRLVEILFWFHPMIWSASRSAARQREFVSDDAAAEDPSGAVALLKGMWRLAETRTKAATSLPAGLTFDVRSRVLELRVARLLEKAGTRAQSRSSADSPGGFWLVAAAVAAALIWVPVPAGVNPRGFLSPWPRLTATALREFSIVVRDYEVDGHRDIEDHDHVSR